MADPGSVLSAHAVSGRGSNPRRPDTADAAASPVDRHLAAVRRALSTSNSALERLRRSLADAVTLIYRTSVVDDVAGADRSGLVARLLECRLALTDRMELLNESCAALIRSTEAMETGLAQIASIPNRPDRVAVMAEVLGRATGNIRNLESGLILRNWQLSHLLSELLLYDRCIARTGWKVATADTVPACPHAEALLGIARASDGSLPDHMMLALANDHLFHANSTRLELFCMLGPGERCLPAVEALERSGCELYELLEELAADK